MRLLLIADVHANLEALQAVLAAAAPYAACLFAGDVVDYGPDPAPCLETIRDHAWAAVKGNHDAAVAEGFACGWYGGISPAIREYQRNALAAPHFAFLAGLPLTHALDLGGARFHLVHARPANPLEGYLLPEISDADLASELAQVTADVVLLGHAHRPFVRRLGGMTVVNPGSVGQPRDGDLRASYALWEDGEIRLERVEYDVEATCRRLQALPLPPEDLATLTSILREGR